MEPPRLQMVLRQPLAHCLAGEILMLGERDHLAGQQSRVQRDGPGGGLERAVATNSASSLPESPHGPTRQILCLAVLGDIRRHLGVMSVA